MISEKSLSVYFSYYIIDNERLKIKTVEISGKILTFFLDFAFLSDEKYIFE